MGADDQEGSLGRAEARDDVAKGIPSGLESLIPYLHPERAELLFDVFRGSVELLRMIRVALLDLLRKKRHVAPQDSRYRSGQVELRERAEGRPP